MLLLILIWSYGLGDWILKLVFVFWLWKIAVWFM